jgi:hypothetical protein
MLGQPDAVESVSSRGHQLEALAIAGVFWIIIIWLLFKMVKGVVILPAVARRILPHCTHEQRESFVMWVVELLMTTVALAVVYEYLGFAIVHGSFNAAYIRNSPDLDWSKQTAYFAELGRVMKSWGYAGQPVIFLYLYEICTPTPQRERQVSHHLLVMHHLIAVVMLVFSMKAFTETLSPLWAQALGLLFNHMIMEQPMWLALILYRLKVRGHAFAVAAATVFEIGSRFVLWGLCFWNYANLCLPSATYSAASQYGR